MSIEAMKLALEALKSVADHRPNDETNASITALRQAIEQAEQAQPVAWKTDDVELYVREDKFGFYNIPLYTSPPPRQPLTDEEIWAVAERCEDSRFSFARAIEAAHGIGEKA